MSSFFLSLSSFLHYFIICQKQNQISVLRGRRNIKSARAYNIIILTFKLKKKVIFIVVYASMM
jgi:hypothetical protein